jgi:hypothetical protein
VLEDVLEELAFAVLLGAGVGAAGADFVVSDDVAELEDSDEEASDGALVEVVDVALAPRLSFL